MTRTAIIVQARIGSTRLPGKVLMPLGGRSVLSHVLERCQAIPGADGVCCAVPDAAENDPVAAEAEARGAAIFRGSESDVLARYLGAAEQMNASVILRVTSDCPLIDPTVCGDVLALRAGEAADYACNNMPPSWPHGLDCEAFSLDWLVRAAREATDPFDREHVTPFIRGNKEVRAVNLPSPDPGLARHRWTLDTPNDFSFFEAVWPHLPEGPDAWGCDRVLAIVEDRPDIAAINAQEAADSAKRRARA